MESELKFDKAMEQLEKIVEDLESGNMPLEDALKKYEEGVKLSRLCTQKLTEAETKIETLTKALNTSAEDAKSPRKKERKKTKSPVQDSDAAGNELLL
ncbi:MAG: exodeoxyribonuclease VII small subunit [Candidatus Omnitrophica bacterium]|nr:exodeoxyribonuclease VII small subunit [Candidatus Omnitrophota bacterium]